MANRESRTELIAAGRTFAADAAHWHDACTWLVVALGILTGVCAYLVVGVCGECGAAVTAGARACPECGVVREEVAA